MGIVTSILSRIALPLGIAVVAGFILVTFKDRITGAITGGAETLGSIISSPFGSVLQGIQSGFQNIPQFIDFRLPEFRFATGDSGFNGQVLPPQAGTVPFMGGQLTTPEGCTVDSLGRTSCPTPPLFTLDPTPSPAPVVQGSPTPSPLTIFQGGSFRTAVTLPSGFSGIRTRQEIIESNPNVIGLFDILSTSKTEFIPLTALQVQQQQDNIRLSAQLFEEAKNVQEALSFA